MNEPALSLRSVAGWGALLGGQAVFVFAVAALTGPGRIDILDGQTRFEVSRSLFEHGDSIIRDPAVKFVVFPGRDGQRYTEYRLPQSLVGVAAILAADATGPVSEGRRHVFFLLTSAVALAVLAVVYTLWFRSLGHSPAAAVAWSLGGIFCLPSWYYGTSTFDDIWGVVTAVPAVVLAFLGRRRFPLSAATGAGLLLGIAFNVKPPLGLFVLPVLAALRDPDRPVRAQLGRFVIVCLGVAAGVALYQGYDRYKFPPETLALRAELFRRNLGPFWSEHPFVNLLALVLSPGGGFLWYCPAAILGLVGLAAWRCPDRRLCGAVAVACSGFLAFVSCLAFAKGDVCWGPRYLTPCCALLWLFAPDGVPRLARRWVVGLLAAGFLVQVLGLSVDPHRRYIQLGMPAGYSHFHPEIYFDLRVAHLSSRPAEIVEILQAGPAEAFTPAPRPTFTLPNVNDYYPGGETDEAPAEGRRAVQKYRVLNSFRPWWHSQLGLVPELRPVDLGATLVLLVGSSRVDLQACKLEYSIVSPK